MCFYSLFTEGVQKVFGTLDLFVSLLETEIKYPILQGGILPFWTPSLQVLIGDFFQHIDGRNYGLDKKSFFSRPVPERNTDYCKEYTLKTDKAGRYFLRYSAFC